MPDQNCTINAEYAEPEIPVMAGQKITLQITTSGTTSYNVSFGNKFRSQGVLSTGTISGKIFMISFEYNGTEFVEIGGRGLAM